MPTAAAMVAQRCLATAGCGLLSLVRYAELHDGYVQVSLQLERPTAPPGEGEMFVCLVTEHFYALTPASRCRELVFMITEKTAYAGIKRL
jgi:hypothetical protein